MRIRVLVLAVTLVLSVSPQLSEAVHDHLKIALPCLGGPEVCGQWSAPFYPAAVTADPTCIDSHGDNAFREVATGLCVQDPNALNQASVNATLLKNGRVLYYSGVDATATDWPLTDPNYGKSRVWNPATGAVSVPTPESGGGGDLFCSSNTLLPDGRVLVVGGTEWVTPPAADTPPTQPHVLVKGLTSARIYSPATNSWTPTDSMATNRWYPSVYQLADGRMIVLSGTGDLGDVTTHRQSVEVFDPATNRWDLDSNRLLPLYARAHVLPGGKLYYSGVGALWAPFGEESAVADHFGQTYDPATRQWQNVGTTLFGSRQHGWSVLLPLRPQDAYRTEVLITNGTLDRTLLATNTSEIADFGFAPGGALATEFTPLNPVPRAPIAPSTVGRWFAHFTMLPDGNVLLAGGGTSDDVLAIGGAQFLLNAELFDPRGTTNGLRGRWSMLGFQSIPRAYHSTALLLPDATVLSMGHVPIAVGIYNQVGPAAAELGVVEKRFEVFRPPYLFRGPRPTITNAPGRASYGQTFTVRTADARAIQSVVLVRPGSATHATDFDQRVVELQVTQRTSHAVTVVAPPNSSVAPAGTYMLFVNKGTINGPIPSVAKFIDIR
jgi:hypothetical protein